MTPIQQKVLNYTLAGHDAIGRAQTGTGKTAAFLISVINDLLNNPIKEQRYRGEARALIPLLHVNWLCKLKVMLKS